MADLPVRINPHALEEAEGARAWYAERNPVAANLFLDELHAAVERVHEAPERWPRLRRNGDFRRCFFPNFPYSLIYRIRVDEIEVTAIAHHRRRPNYWKRR